MSQSESPDGSEVEEPPDGYPVLDESDDGRPIVLVTSYPKRYCGIGTFSEEKREFLEDALRSRDINRDTHVICHTEGEGRNVHPDIDISDDKWPEKVAKEVHNLKPEPYVVDIQHEYGLWAEKKEDSIERFLHLMDLLRDVPTFIEFHTVHGRLDSVEKDFIKALKDRCGIMAVKCDYQRDPRMKWNIGKIPANMRVIPHGVRPDKGDLDRYECRAELAKRYKELGALDDRLVLGCIGWMQNNKGFEYVIPIFEPIYYEVEKKTGKKPLILLAGRPRGGDEHFKAFDDYMRDIEPLEKKGMAVYVDFIPRGDEYYEMMAACDVIALSHTDETQSGTFARALAVGVPFVARDLEGLGSQTIESGAGCLFSNQRTLKRELYRLLTQPELREEKSNNARVYVQEYVGWPVIIPKYLDAYREANTAHVRAQKEALVTV